MHRADKAVLRLAIGLGLSVLIAYGLALPAAVRGLHDDRPAVVQARAADPVRQGHGAGRCHRGLLAAGVLMVPILENYAVAGVVLTGALLYAVYFAGARSANPLTIILVIAFTVIPVAGVADQALSTALASPWRWGSVSALWSAASHTRSFLTLPGQPHRSGARHRQSGSGKLERPAGYAGLMPVFVLALTNPAFYLPAIIKTVTLGQQAGSTSARSAGRELVGSTLMGACDGDTGLVRPVAVAEPVDADLVDDGCSALGRSQLFGIRRTSFAPSFWSNALVTMLILLGPAIEDAAVGKDVYKALPRASHCSSPWRFTRGQRCGCLNAGVLRDRKRWYSSAPEQAESHNVDGPDKRQSGGSRRMP